MAGKPNCKRCLKPKSECKCGRPPKIDKDCLQKLEDAFAFCYTDKEACLYAGISPTALYNYQLKHPEFVERKEALRLSPNLMAKKVLVEGIKGSIDQSRWWAKNKIGDEFSEQSTIKHGGRIETDINSPEAKGIEEAVKAFNENMRLVLTKKKKDNGNKNS